VASVSGLQSIHLSDTVGWTTRSAFKL